jgi:hypothetical protein
VDMSEAVSQRRVGGWVGLVGAVLLVACACFVLWRGVPAVRGYTLYYQVKYGALRDAAPVERVGLLAQVYAWLPGQYYVCLLASDICWDAYLSTHGDESADWAAQSLSWCERGLDTGCGLPSFYSRKASLLARESMRAAASYWEWYVDRVYWHPPNQSLMCELYAEAGMLEEAAERLALLEGFPEYETAAALFRNAVHAQMKRR